MANNWRERLESIGKREPDEVSKRIMADIEANKKRNKELSDKRTRDAVDAVESVLNQGSGAADSPAKASSKSKKAGKSSKTSSSTSTKVRAQKGGSMTAETTTKEARNQATAVKQIEKTLNAPDTTKRASNASSEKKKKQSLVPASASARSMHTPNTYRLSNKQLTSTPRSMWKDLKKVGDAINRWDRRYIEKMKKKREASLKIKN